MSGRCCWSRTTRTCGRYLTRLLRSDGWNVTAVADAAAALRLPSPPPDLILTDVMLSGTDGLELVGTLRRLPTTAPAS